MSYEDARNVGTVDYLLILNRNENIIPAVAQALTRSRRPRTSCSARPPAPRPAAPPRRASSCGCRGRTRSSRSPTGCRATACSSCSRSHPIETYLLNTGRVGGKDDDDRSKKVKIPHTSACVKGIAEQTIAWDDDPDFGYQVASAVPDFDDDELLQPRRLYERQGRVDEYDAIVERLKSERVAHLQEFPQLSEEIIKAVG